MPYVQVKGRKPFERASKIAHAEIINNPMVEAFLDGCALPSAPPKQDVTEAVGTIPPATGNLTTVIAIDGGMNEAVVRPEFPSASITFMTLGPLMLYLEELAELDAEPFIGPEDMQRLKNIKRYSLVVPCKAVRSKRYKRFSIGVRAAIQEFLIERKLVADLQWLLFREWTGAPVTWSIPRCPNPACENAGKIVFVSGGQLEKACPECKEPVFISDALRLYELINDEQGAGGIMGYLLAALEQIVLVHVIRYIYDEKPRALREVLFVKDGPLAFFGTTAPLRKPMRELVRFLADHKAGPLINLIGLEKTGAFVEHAALIEEMLQPGQYLLLGNSYIYRYIVPGDPQSEAFGHNTYYGAKIIFKGGDNAIYVATIPTRGVVVEPGFSQLINGPDVLAATGRLRCSMYDNALLPIVLANRLVSLADVPSSEILQRFARERIQR